MDEFGTYIMPKDVLDEVMQPLITIDDVDAATQYINKIARALKVVPTDIPRDPVPIDVVELARAYCCGRRAKLTSGLGARLDTTGTDIYELKRRLYSVEVQTLTAEMTAEKLLGLDPTLDPTEGVSISLERG